MTLENKLNITDQIALAKAEGKISKQKAKQLFDLNDIRNAEVGTFNGLAYIHRYLFEDIYDFAGQVRDRNVADGDDRFTPFMYLDASLKQIDAMPQGDFNEIIEKYVEMHIAHPFRKGSRRATRIWLDALLKQQLQQVINWSQVDKEEYLSAMQRSVVKDVEIKVLLNQALSDQVNDRTLFMKSIDVSYFYEGYSESGDLHLSKIATTKAPLEMSLADDILVNKATTIESCLARIRAVYGEDTKHFSSDVTRQESVILNLQRSCVAALDMANRCAHLHHLGTPQSSRDSFQLLFQAGWINETTNQHLQAMVGLRKVAVHDFQTLTTDMLKHVIEHRLDDLTLLAHQVIQKHSIRDMVGD